MKAQCFLLIMAAYHVSYSQKKVQAKSDKFIRSPDSMKTHFPLFSIHPEDDQKIEITANNYNMIGDVLPNWTKDSIQWIAVSRDSAVLWLGKSSDISTDWVGVSGKRPLNKDIKLQRSATEKSIRMERNIPSERDIANGKEHLILAWAPAKSEILDSVFNRQENLTLSRKMLNDKAEFVMAKSNRLSKGDITQNFPFIKADVIPMPIKTLAVIPSIKDLSQYVPYIGDQSNIYSCSAWAVAGAKSIQDAIVKQQIFSTKDNVNEYYSPSFIYTLAKKKAQSNLCTEGVDIGYALNVLEIYGVPALRDCPYFPNDWNCSSMPISKELYDSARKHVDLGLAVKLNILDFQYVLSHDCPIAIETVIDDDFKLQGIDRKWTTKNPFIWRDWKSETTMSQRENHCMICVGYNDYYGAFLVLNSKGSKFGNNGFFWIDYNFMFRTVQNAYKLNTITYNEMRLNDKQIIDKLNGLSFRPESQTKLSLGLKSKGKAAFDLNFSCFSIEKMSNQVVVHLSVTGKNGDTLRRDIPISYEICSVFSVGDYNYYIQLQSIDERKVISGFVLNPKSANILITKLPVSKK